MPVDFMRVDACPRCGRGFPDSDPTESSIGCPVCEGRPVRAIIIWNSDVDRLKRRDKLQPGERSGAETRESLAGAAALAAANIVERPESVCGRLYRALTTVTAKGQDRP